MLRHGSLEDGVGRTGSEGGRKMSKYNVGDTVYYLSRTETYRFILRDTIESSARGGYWVSGCDYLSIPTCQLYATEEEAKAARLAYYNREVEEAQKALDNARARLSNAAGWRERAEREK
jgi:hypothetical protein